jgi:hypothetical protein|tara:strand:- start:9941 stop:10342 length:402 start_codon:yes stop_codon:yes gene_type:complete
MIKTQLRSDQAAMTLSMVCVVHCFFAPSVLIIGSGFLAVNLGNELVHKLIVLTAVPISAVALYLGYKNHKVTTFIPIGIFGLVLLIFAVTFGESIWGELGEKGLTLFGSFLVAYSHFRNYQVCKAIDCNCHEK